MERCARCQLKIRDGGRVMPLGHKVCGRCAMSVDGAALGLLSGGGLGGAIAGPGILRWISDALHPQRRRSDGSAPTDHV